MLEDGIALLRASGRLAIFEQGYPDFPAEDISAFLDANRFPFAMMGTPQEWNDITYIDVERFDVGEGLWSQ